MSNKNTGAMVKPAFEKFVSPKGKAGFTALVKPSTKFKEDGEYSASLVLPAKSKEAKKFIERIDELMELSRQNACEQLGKKNVSLAKPPYKMEVDDEGEETGNIVFKFSIEARKQTKMGTRVNKVALFDSKRRPLSSSVSIGSGTELRIKGSAKLWYTPLHGAGVKLQPEAAQIIELVEFVPNGGGDYSADGFDEEDGFEEDTELTTTTEEEEDDDLDDF